MGCDIHVYLEYASNTCNGEEHWGCLVRDGGRRDYRMFDILAGVRGPGEHIVVEPRGLPDGKMSWDVDQAAYCRITDDDARADWDGYCSRERAEQWGGGIEQVRSTDGEVLYERTPGPDWHNHSWLTADELAQCLGRYICVYGGDGPYHAEWDAMLAAMRAFEDAGHKPRLVFWFDN